MKAILRTAAGNVRNQDRGLIFQSRDRFVLCVADGAGGISGGEQAASTAIELIQRKPDLLVDGGSCSETLRRIDLIIADGGGGGETTCVVAVVAPVGIFGASVGDSGAWFIPAKGPAADFTRAQQRKPLLGSGRSCPIPFLSRIEPGSLLLATDGLFKYTSAEQIARSVQAQEPEIATEQLIQLVRYPSRALPDDVTVIVARLE